MLIMATEYIFTETYARVFFRHLEYQYNQILKEVYEKTIHFASTFVFEYSDAKCTVIYQDTLSSPQIVSAYLRIDFCPGQHYGYAFGQICIWEIEKQIDLDQIREMFQLYVGKSIRVCLCDNLITNLDMNQCQECFVFNVADHECCICLESGYRWVKLLCDCKGGRIIHLHCFQQLPAQFIDQMCWKKKCPCCRKMVGIWKGTDLIENPDFQSKS